MKLKSLPITPALLALPSVIVPLTASPFVKVSVSAVPILKAGLAPGRVRVPEKALKSLSALISYNSTTKAAICTSVASTEAMVTSLDPSTRNVAVELFVTVPKVTVPTLSFAPSPAL